MQPIGTLPQGRDGRIVGAVAGGCPLGEIDRPPLLIRLAEPTSAARPEGRRAGEEIRTLDILVGNEMLYQLSYARVSAGAKLGEGRGKVQGIFSIPAGKVNPPARLERFGREPRVVPV